MIFRQLFDPESSTYTYLLGCARTHKALLIDPVLEQAKRDFELVAQLGLELALVLDTHVHADHVTAAGVLRDRTRATTVASALGPECADRRVAAGEVVRLGDLALRVLATPGHTDDSVSYLLVDSERPETSRGHVFTGDTLLVRGCGRTDFQNGDAGQLYDSIVGQLFALPDATLVWPAHDYLGRTVTSIGEERLYNARVAGRTREQFVTLMNDLKLDPPKRLAEAVPANQACGRQPGSSSVQ